MPSARTGLRPVKVQVAGQTLALRTDASPSYMRELAAVVDARLVMVRERNGQIQSTQALALLCALQLADELTQHQTRDRALREAVRERTERILRHLDALAAPEQEPPRARKRKAEGRAVTTWR